MTKKHVYEQPRTTVCQLEEIYGLLAASSGEAVTLDNKTLTNVNWESKEENPESIDAKENTLGTTLWND
jgi:hypothetical protein